MNLPPELAHFASFLEAQPGPVQVAFQYCLAVMRVEAGKAELVETRPGEQSAACVFKIVAGDVFSVVKPQITEEQEADLIAQLREILEDEQP